MRGSRQLGKADGVVNLAGESIFGRWTEAKKRRLGKSRVETSRLVAEAFGTVRRRPLVLVQGSAIGYYGNPGDRPVDESAPPGDDFLARLAVDWEAASAPVEALGVRRPIARTSIVLSRRGGAMKPLALAFRSFVGGRLGDGRQPMPWIHDEDEVGAIRFLLESPQATGPFNLVAPEPATNAELSQALARVLHRPNWLPVPSFAVRLALGELRPNAARRSARRTRAPHGPGLPLPLSDPPSRARRLGRLVRARAAGTSAAIAQG